MANVVQLKVGLHCDECIKKILKAIKKIEDIETYDIDTKLNKVTVTGNVTTEEVIRVLHKIGKQATNWEEEPSPSPNNI
ncbi:hypothetical protein M9H77_10784 [Catharanthus roseus]|uniref:Uncharacterized protein n=1 Tax=Catharanthus roseus TaxID=4058 RepID=A0ACC0BCR6_CATRO|nr:hypothetical protein M9H77_10784 [Catharanthus roseus]